LEQGRNRTNRKVEQSVVVPGPVQQWKSAEDEFPRSCNGGFFDSQLDNGADAFMEKLSESPAIAGMADP